MFWLVQHTDRGGGLWPKEQPHVGCILGQTNASTPRTPTSDPSDGVNGSGKDRVSEESLRDGQSILWTVTDRKGGCADTTHRP